MKAHVSFQRIVWVFAVSAVLASAGAVTAQQLSPELLEYLEWREIGPAMTSGRISAIAVVENIPKIIYVTSATGGAWKSTNHGITWEPVLDDVGSASMGAILSERLPAFHRDLDANDVRWTPGRPIAMPKGVQVPRLPER